MLCRTEAEYFDGVIVPAFVLREIEPFRFVLLLA